MKNVWELGQRTPFCFLRTKHATLTFSTCIYARITEFGSITSHFQSRKPDACVVPEIKDQFQVAFSYTDVARAFIVRAKVTADNTSIRVSWDWSCQGVPMHINSVRVHYQPEGGSLMMYTVGSTTATSATLPNLQCSTKYTVSVYTRSGQINRTSIPRMVYLPARGMYMLCKSSYSLL